MADSFSGRPDRQGRPAKHGKPFGRQGPSSGRQGGEALERRKEGRPAGHPGGHPAGHSGGKPFGKRGGPDQADLARQAEQTHSFRPGQELFPAFSRELSLLLDQPLLRALRKAWPLSRAHQASLPWDIAELSEILTSSRADLRSPYWAKPSLTSAYLYYFLPWNLVRLCRLFAGMRLPEPAADRPQILVDLGSGPLTVPLALWLARPSWRKIPLEVAAVDCAGRPPRLGAAVLEALAGEAGEKPWKVRAVQAPLAMAARRLKPLLAGASPFLITAANVLNELPPERRGCGGLDGGVEWQDDPGGMQGMDEAGVRAASQLEGMASEGSLSSLLSSLMPLLRARRGQTPPRLLFIEPGTRLGGSTLMELRALALDEGLLPAAPCPHGFACPLRRDAGDEWQDGPRLASRLAGRTWCHFTFGAQGAPAWLARLSADAGLGKDSLSLACLDLAVPAGLSEDGFGGPGDDAEACSAAGGAQPPAAGEDATEGRESRIQAGAAGDAEELPGGRHAGLHARVVSQPFRVPGLRGLARYACTARGLVLLEDAAQCPSGSLLDLSEDALGGARRDARSGALIAQAPGTAGRPQAQDSAGGAPRISGGVHGASGGPAGEAGNAGGPARRAMPDGGPRRNASAGQGAGRHGSGHGGQDGAGRRMQDQASPRRKARKAGGPAGRRGR